MRRIILVLRVPAPVPRKRVPAAAPPKKVPPVLTYGNLSRGYFPRRGILYSLLIHEIAFIGMLYLPGSGKLTEWSRTQKIVRMIHRSEPMQVMYLPMLGGGDPGVALLKGRLEARHRGPSVATAPGTQGLSYPGRQPILSDVPDPTNFIQTVLQPTLEHPRILIPPVLLPNLVLMADAGPVPHLEPPSPAVKPPDAAKPMEQQPAAPSGVRPEVKATALVLPPDKLTMPKAIDAPRLVLPAGVFQNALVPGTKPPEPPPKIEPPEPVVTPPPAKNLSIPKDTSPAKPLPRPVEKPKIELPEPVTATPAPKNPPIPKDANPAKPSPRPVEQPKIELPEPVIPTPAPKNPPIPKDANPAKPSPKPVEQPKIELPEPVIATPAPKNPPIPKDTSSAKPAPKPVEQPKVEPPAKTLEGLKEPVRLELSPQPARGTDLLNLVALTPMPALREPPFEVPSGEARGRFAISPKPNLTASETEPGSKLEAPPSAAGTARPTAVPAGNKATGTAAPVAAAGIGASADAAKDKNASGAGTGAETVRGIGVVSAPGPVVVSGSGTSSGSGSGAFAGITIVGGVRETGIAANSALHTPTPRPLQTSYDLTVISTESSGGGLPFFGVFSQEQVYTVYLDMRETEIDPAPAWTLELAVLQDTAAQANAAKSPSRSQQGLVLPFPAVKERPALPAELVRRYPRRMIIVFAVINIEGKMEQLSVKESPDTLLNEPVLSALSKWVFRPARLDGEPVRAKVLLGIPLWLPE